MTQAQMEKLRGFVLDGVLTWRHMVASPVAEIRQEMEKRYRALAVQAFDFISSLPEGTVVQVVGATTAAGEPVAPGVMAGALMRLLVWGSGGRFLGYHTVRKTDSEYWEFVKDDANAIGDDGKPAKNLPKRSKSTYWVRRYSARAGDEYVVTASIKHDTSEGKQDPEARLASDEAAGVVTLWCPERRKRDQRNRVADAERAQEVVAWLEARGETPTEKELAECQVKEPKVGDGCRCLNANQVLGVTLDKKYYEWQVA